MPADAVTSYDEVPYSSTPFYYTQPDCLATMATLHGMTPAAADHCRVLELGCGRGGNLIPLAVSLPESRFVGIDLSRRQVAEGRSVVEKLGLSNIELRPMNILDIDEGFGSFDYIICHGVYSWVPDEVRDQILVVCRQNLAPQGVAYVSYNTYPGWHLRAILRDVLNFHVRGSADAPSRLRQARAFLDLVVRSVQDGKTVYARLLREEGDLLRSEAESYLFHEFLEEENSPLYFYQFAAQAAAHGLQYLEEAEPAPFKIPAEVLNAIRQAAPDLIQGEQYLDFLRGRTFRRTLLCHEEIALKRPPDPQTLYRCHVTTRLRPRKAEGEPGPNEAEEFQTVKGSSLSTNNPFLRAAFHYLFEAWPRSVPFAELWDAVLSRLEGTQALGAGSDLLAVPLLQCFQSGVMELHLQPPRFVLEVSERPLASPLARLQAQNSDRVTNLRHYTVELNSLDRQVVQRLDGSRDRPSILESLTALVASGTFAIHADGQPLSDVRKAASVLAESLEPCLHRLAGHALLMG
jgi:methyltransferase-like protein/cyclopropane fatty-acyl-phospholipid synthase-like methyltransferase